MSDVQRVVLADDDLEMRAVVRIRLALDGFEVVDETGEVDELVESAALFQPGFVVIGLEMRANTGVSAIARVRRVAPESSIVVFSWFPDPVTLADVLSLGADLYVDRAGGPAKLSAYLRSVAAHPACGRGTGSERLRQVRAELRELADIGRERPLRVEEQRRMRRLLLVEERLFNREWDTATVD